MDEKRIIDLIRQRQPQGAEELLRYFGPLIRYIIAPILPQPQDQEECLSETLLKVWDKIEQFDEKSGSWKGWLTAITRNTALNHARRNRRHNSTEEISETIPSAEPTPEEKLLQQEKQALLRKAVSSLSSTEQIIFYRKYYYMQPLTQIASEMGLTQRAVEGRLYRIRKRLQQYIGGEQYGQE